MFTLIHGVLRRYPAFRRAARWLMGKVGLDITKAGNTLGLIEKKISLALKGGKDRLDCLNVGGAHFFKPGWGVLDYTGWKYRFLWGAVDWQHNLASVDRFPLRDNSIRLLYSSHCIEHIPEEFVSHNFAEFFRCMKPDGIIHITIPDFDQGYAAIKKHDDEFWRVMRNYPDDERNFVHLFVAGYWAARLSPEEIRRKLDTLSKSEIETWATELTKAVPFEWTKTHQDHVSWWNPAKLRGYLEAAGFRDVRQIEAGQSRTPEMRGEGLPWGFDNREENGSMVLEAVVPAVKGG